MADGPALYVTFLGMAGAFSLPPLEALLAAGVAVREVVLPGTENRPMAPRATEGGLPVLTPYAERSIVHLAWERAIPVWEVADLGALAPPDVLVVACFPRLVPRAVWSRARLAVNVHPSLLPDNRGPAPLYWTFRLGQRRTGVTVHLLADRADAGDILAQREVHIPDGMAEAELELQLARLGGELLVQVLRDFERDRLRPLPQDESRATSHPWPSRG
jgi:methionyl-tRNA formyltransferase